MGDTRVYCTSSSQRIIINVNISRCTVKNGTKNTKKITYRRFFHSGMTSSCRVIRKTGARACIFYLTTSEGEGKNGNLFFYARVPFGSQTVNVRPETLHESNIMSAT